MPRFLVSESDPEGDRLEEILRAVRNDLFEHATKIMTDERPEAAAVLGNSIKIMNLLSESIELAEESKTILRKSFGRHDPNSPRIGVC